MPRIVGSQGNEKCEENAKKNFDIRLKENFKLFVSGPSRCGKTVFVSKLIENIQSFAKQPPKSIIYVYKVWQDKYDEMSMMGINFIEDHENIVDQIKSSAKGQAILVIFDDLIGSNSLPDIANMFTVDARHLNISMVFLSQRLFVNNEYFRQISHNCDYFCLFKNPRNPSEIRALAQQMTPGNMVLVPIYMDATKMPFSYLFINLTQECDDRVKYLSNLLDGVINVYVNQGKSFKKYIAYGSFDNITITPANIQRNITLQPFKPFEPRMLHNNNSYPSQQLQSQNVYLHPQKRCAPCQSEEDELNIMKQEANGNQYVQTNSNTGTNTPLPANQFTQTIRPSQTSTGMGTERPQHMQIQTTRPQQMSMGTETNIYNDRNIQTNEIRCVDHGTSMTSTVMGTQTPVYRSEYARQIAAMPMDTSENNGQVTLPPLAIQQPSIKQPSYKPSLPAPAHQQPLFIQPPSQQYASPQQLTLPQPPQYPPLAQPPQYPALAQPPQYPALPQPPKYPALPPPPQQPIIPAPQQPLAIDYNPRGEKRMNADVREEEKKKIILDDDRTDSVKRKGDGDGDGGKKKKKKLILDCGKRGQLIWE